MYPKINRDALEKRFTALQRLAKTNTRALAHFLLLPPHARASGIKRDRTKVTILDYETNLRSLKQCLQEFPNDSFDGEESHMIRPHASFAFLEDPVDNTWHAIGHRPDSPKEKRWITYMASILYKGAPVAFALGLPLHNQLYYGSVTRGIFKNGKKYNPPREKTSLIIGNNEGEHSDELMQLAGVRTIGIAGLCAWLILQGKTSAGINPFHLPHEGTCIAAIAPIHGCNSNKYPRPAISAVQ